MKAEGGKADSRCLFRRPGVETLNGTQDLTHIFLINWIHSGWLNLVKSRRQGGVEVCHLGNFVIFNDKIYTAAGWRTDLSYFIFTFQSPVWSANSRRRANME